MSPNLLIINFMVVLRSSDLNDIILFLITCSYCLSSFPFILTTRTLQSMSKKLLKDKSILNRFVVSYRNVHTIIGI